MIRFGDQYIDPFFISLVRMEVRPLEFINPFYVVVSLIDGTASKEGVSIDSIANGYTTEEQMRTVAGNLVAAIKRYKPQPRK